MKAEDLTASNQVVDKEGGIASVLSMEFLEEETTVYNFEVLEHHNYFVSALGLLVHNVCEGAGDTFKFSDNFEKKLKKHSQDIYETSRDLGIPVTKGDKDGMKKFISSITNDPNNLANSSPFVWNTVQNTDAYVKGNAVVLVNRDTNEILTFLNGKGDRLSPYLKSILGL